MLLATGLLFGPGYRPGTGSRLMVWVLTHDIGPGYHGLGSRRLLAHVLGTWARFLAHVHVLGPCSCYGFLVWVLSPGYCHSLILPLIDGLFPALMSARGSR